MCKIKNWQEIEEISEELKRSDKKIVFTNGCFDILHAGHISYIREAKALGDILMIGLNSDGSVKRLKGPDRPINDQKSRALLLSELKSIDYIIIFEEATPYDLINCIKPNILVKGGDWKINEIVGSDIVLSTNGIVKSLKFLEGYSSTKLINRMKNGK